MRFRVPADELECAALERLAVKKLLGSRPRATVAALVEAVDPVDPLLLDELERAVAARRRSRDGT
jgi:hypothetical protein